MLFHMINGVIYLYTSPSGKHYIGQTTNQNLRRKKWFNMGSPYTSLDWKSKIDKARKKYGPNSFTYTILFQKEYISRKAAKLELNILETYYIGLYDSYRAGYNSTIGGDSATGPTKHSEQTKAKMSSSHLGKKMTEQVKAKLSRALTGIKRSEEFKEKARISHQGQVRTKESIQKQIQAQYKRVAMIDLGGNIIRVFNSVSAAAKYVGRTIGSISIACKRGTVSAGYKWALINNK